MSPHGAAPEDGNLAVVGCGMQKVPTPTRSARDASDCARVCLKLLTNLLLITNLLCRVSLPPSLELLIKLRGAL